MASHWSEDETLDLFNISIKNFQKFVHLKNQNESEKFFEEKFFARFHNLGRNAKNIKNRIEGIQKKFRKNVKNLNVNHFKSGDIPEEIYTCIGSKKVFNTCFDYERLFGKYTGSKEFIKMMEVVSQSDYWKSIRMQLQISRNNNSLKTLSYLHKETPLSDTIMISSAESSPDHLKISEIDDLSTFKDIESLDSQNKNKITRRLSSYSDIHFDSNNIEVIKRKRNISMTDFPPSKIQIMPRSITNVSEVLKNYNDIYNIDIEVQTDLVTSISKFTQVDIIKNNQETSTDNCSVNFTPPKIQVTEIDSSKCFQDIILALNNMVKEQSKANDIMTDISKSLKDIVNQKVVFLSCNTSDK